MFHMRCFAELISCNGTSEHHHPHPHFPLRLERFSRDTWEMQGRLWQRHFSLQHNLFQMKQPDYLCSTTPCSFLLLLEMFTGKKKVKFLVVYMSTLALHASPCSAWDVCPGVASNPAWILMGTIWKGSFILWQYVTVESITKQISETEIIKCSPCNQVTHTHSLLKGLCWVQNFVLISLLLSLPVFKEVIFRSKILSKD